MRYEFRHFAVALGALRARLRDLAGGKPGDEEEREDLYLVARGQIGAILKLRDDTLDLKLLVRREGPLELWEPSFRMRFPIPPHSLDEHFLTPAALFLPPFGGAAVSAEAFVAAVGAAPGIRAITVRKRRERFRIGGALVEFARIGIGGRTFETVALESEDRAEVEGLAATLGLGDAVNVSYQRFLHALSFE